MAEGDGGKTAQLVAAGHQQAEEGQVVSREDAVAVREEAASSSAVPSQAAQPAEDGEDIDDIMGLLDAMPGEDPKDIDELLDTLVPGRASPKLSAAPEPQVLERFSSLGGGSLVEAAEGAAQPDLPDPLGPLPPNVMPIPFVSSARFSLRCALDLKKVAFSLRHAEYNPRKHSSITVRLMEPKCTAMIGAQGSVVLIASLPEDELKRAAKRFARMVQRCGYEEEAKFADYRITSTLFKADLGFPVRLDLLAAKWRRNALYEPEFCCSCVFRTRVPKVTYLVTHGGKVTINGTRSVSQAREALERAYWVFKDFVNWAPSA